MIANKKALFVMLVDRVPRFEAHCSQSSFFAKVARDRFVVLTNLSGA
jgi:hypothetical protein